MPPDWPESAPPGPAPALAPPGPIRPRRRRRTGRASPTGAGADPLDRTGAALLAAAGRGGRFAVDQLAEAEPRVVAAERCGQLVATDLGHAAGPVEARPDDPRGRPALGDLHFLEPPVQVGAEPGADFGPAELQRPGVQRAVVVVGVFDADQIGDRGPEEDVLDALGVAARAGREVRFRDLAVVGDDLAPGGFGGLVGRRGLAGEAFVDLAAGVVVEVEAVAADLHRERVGAGRHGLCPQRRLRPGGRRLVGDHAFHVLVDGDPASTAFSEPTSESVGTTSSAPR